MHTHIIPADMPNWTEKFGYGDFIYLQHHRDGFAKMMKGNQFFREIKSNCWDPDVRIEEYKAFNTQVQVVCTIPVMFSYWARPMDCLALSMFLNDHLAELCDRYPKNYIGLGTVPMQDIDLAIQELERCRELGLPGIQIGSNVNQENLSEPKFFPFFRACQELDMALLIHPWEMMGMKDMTKYWLPWLVGMPAETARAIASLIFSGTLERLPDLRVNFAHASGSFLATIGRISHGFDCRPDLVAIDNNIPPAEYLGKFWVDSITHDPRMLSYVLEMVGSEKVTLGTDYPFPLGDLEIGTWIEEMGLKKKEIDNMFCNSTLAWLNLTKEKYV